MNISQLAINSVSTKQSGLVEALDAYAAAGFRNVEFVLPLLKNWIGEGHSAADASRLLEERGLRCIGGFEAGLDCFSPPEKQDANHSLHLRNARLVHEMGGGTIVVGTDGPAQPGIEALQQVGRTLRSLADQCSGLDVNFALEFNWSPLVKSFKSAVIACEAADHERVGILFDPAHYYTTTSKPEHLDARSVPLIKHVHFNDMRDLPGEFTNCNSDRVLPGQGVLDLADLIARLERHGYTGFYSMEMFNEDLWKLSTAEAARQCYQSLLPLCR